MPVAPVREIVATPIAEPAKVEAAPTTRVVAPIQTASPAGLVPGFYINVGLFAVPGNGTNAFKKLEAAQLPVFSDPIVRRKVTLTRVRVGPFATKALADAAAEKIHALKLDAVVFKH
jgi:cell division septation protein DedD